MSKHPKPTVHDKQIEVWSNALKVAIEFVQSKANLGEERAKKCLMAIMAILYENEGDY